MNMRSPFTWLVVMIAFHLAPAFSVGNEVPNPTTDGWLKDLDFVVAELTSAHPDLHRHLSAEAFEQHVAALRTEIPRLDDDQIVMRLAQLVTSLADGHTILFLATWHGFADRFPIRLRRFADGMYIHAIEKTMAQHLGAQVTAIGNHPAEEAYQMVTPYISGDSEFTIVWRAPFVMSIAKLLHSLGIIDSARELPLTTVDCQGREQILRIPLASDDSELTGWQAALDDPPAPSECLAALKVSPEHLPLHMRGFLPEFRTFWYEYLEEPHTLYMQMNLVYDGPEETMAAFVDRLWGFYEGNADRIDRFVLDLRYNTGGNGSLLRPLIHEFIRHEKIDQPGRLFALVGNQTFSAASRCVGEMLEHTSVTVVGEPTGGALNWCSDITNPTLPNSRISMWVSTLCWQRGHPADRRGYFPPHVPVLTTGTDFYGGRDALLSRVLAGDCIKLLDILRTSGSKPFLAAYRDQETEFGSYAWWEPFVETELNDAGYELVQAGRLNDALAAFSLNTERHPDSWNAWDSLAEIHMTLENEDLAVEYYQKSLAMNPHNDNARQILQEIQRE